MKLEFSRPNFKQCSIIKFHKTPSSRSRVVTRGQTDRLDGTNSRVEKFC